MADLFEEVDRPRVKAPHLLAGDDLSVDISLLDQERVAAHVADLEREQLLGDLQPLVGDKRDHRRRAELLAREEPFSDRLDLAGCEADHGALTLSRRLVDLLDGVRTRDPAPEDRLAKHRLEDHEAHARAVSADAVGLEPRAEIH